MDESLMMEDAGNWLWSWVKDILQLKNQQVLVWTKNLEKQRMKWEDDLLWMWEWIGREWSMNVRLSNPHSTKLKTIFSIVIGNLAKEYC